MRGICLVGISEVATIVIISIAMLIIIEISIGNNLPMITEIKDSYDDMRDRSINKINTEIKLTDTTLSSWWNTSWNYRKMITINNSQIEEDLTNFTVLINITDNNLKNNALSNGDDIAFTNIYGTVQYNHEIEHFDNSSGHLIAWVMIPQLSSSINTLLYMYYGNAGATNQQNIPGTWDSNYTAVWHFNNNSLADSTSNGYDGTNTGTTYNSNCRINGGREYGGDHRIDVNNFATISTDLTAEAWVYRDPGDTQNEIRLLMEGPRWNSNDWCLYWIINRGVVRFVINSNNHRTSGDYNETSGTWLYIAIAYESGDAFFYKNGIKQREYIGVFDTSIGNSYTTLTIGNQNNGGRGWDGKMDEVRISNINRSENWINTSFNSMNSPDMFYFLGNEESVNTININLMNTGSTVIKTTDVTILVNGTVTSFTCSTSYIYPNGQANFIVDVLSSGEKRIKIVTGNGIADYYIFEGI